MGASRHSVPGGMYTPAAIRRIRGAFIPISRFLSGAGVTPNMVTVFSLFLSMVTCWLLATDYLWTALAVGLTAGFLDLVDGQMAKEFGGATTFGGVLDSTIDRYIEFFMFLGFGLRYFYLGRYPWILLCASAFLGSVMISYVKARAETAGFECKVGRLQRPERLTVIAFGTLFRGTGIDIAMLFLGVFTHVTALQRLLHVSAQDTTAPAHTEKPKHGMGSPSMNG